MPCEKRPVGRIATMTVLQCLALLIILYVFYKTYTIAAPRYRNRRYSTPAAHLKLTSALPLILQICCILECSTRLALLWAIRNEATDNEDGSSKNNMDSMDRMNMSMEEMGMISTTGSPSSSSSSSPWRGTRRYLYGITAIWETLIVVVLYYTKLEKLRLSFNNCAFRMSTKDLNKMNRIFFGTMCILIIVGGLNLTTIADMPAGQVVLAVIGATCLFTFFIMFGLLTHAFRVRMTILVVINERNNEVNPDGTIGVAAGPDESARAVEAANKAFNAGEMVSDFIHTVGHIHKAQKTNSQSGKTGVTGVTPKTEPPRKDTVDRVIEAPVGQQQRVSGHSSSSDNETPDFGAVNTNNNNRKNIIAQSPSSMSSSGFNEDKALNDAGMLQLHHQESTEIDSHSSVSSNFNKRAHERTSTAITAATAASLPADPEVIAPGLDRKLTISSFTEFNRLYLETAAKQCMLCTMDNITMTLAAIAVICWVAYSCLTSQVMFGHFCMSIAVVMAALSGFYSENCPPEMFDRHCGFCNQAWQKFAVATAKIGQAEYQERLAQQRESYTQQKQKTKEF